MDKNFSAIEAWRATKEVSSMVKKLGVLNSLLFDDKTLLKMLVKNSQTSILN